MKRLTIFFLFSLSSRADLVFKECPEYTDQCLTINNKLISKGQLVKILKTNSDSIPEDYKELLTEENLGKLSNRAVIKLGDLESIEVVRKAKEVMDTIREAGKAEEVKCKEDENNGNIITLDTQSLEEEVLPFLKFSKEWSEIDSSKKEAIVAHIASLQSNFSPETDTSVMISNLKDNGDLFGSNYIVQVLIEYIDASLLMNRKELGDIVNPLLREINPEMAVYFKEKYGLLDKYGEEDSDYIRLENLSRFNSAKDIVLNDIKEQDSLRAANEYSGKKTVSLHSYMKALGEGRNGLESDVILRGENRSVALLYGKDSMPILYNSKIGLHTRAPNRQAQYSYNGMGMDIYTNIFHKTLEPISRKLFNDYSKFSCRRNCDVDAAVTGTAGVAIFLVGARGKLTPKTAGQGTLGAIGGVIGGVDVYSKCKEACVLKEKLNKEEVEKSELAAIVAQTNFESKSKQHKKSKDDLDTVNNNLDNINERIEKQKDVVEKATNEQEKIKAKKALDDLNKEKDKASKELEAAKLEEQRLRDEAEAAKLEAERLREEAEKKKKDNKDKNGDTYPINPSVAASLDDSGGMTPEVIACIETDCTLVRPGRETDANGYVFNLTGKTLQIAKKEIFCEKGICKEGDVRDLFGPSGQKPRAMGDDVTNPGKPSF